VAVFTTDGTYVRQIGDANTLTKPGGLAVSADDQLLYVLGDGLLQVFSTNGTFIRTIAWTHTNADVALDPAGYVWLTDWSWPYLKKYTADGVFIAAYPTDTVTGTHPTRLAVSRTGSIWVGDMFNRVAA
jgi:DNA-binding beta-propeller fold protein YncE